MHADMKNQRGFTQHLFFSKTPKKIGDGLTLMELMIVIAVIGILSSYVLASVNGARIKAKNNARNNLVDNYRTAFEILRDETINFPPPTNSTSVCLGVHPNGLCGYTSNTAQDEVINALLNPYLPGPPRLEPMTYLSGQSFVFSGPIYECDGFNGCFTPLRVHLIWQLEGLNQNCSPGIIWASWGGITRCKLDL
ncbi:MAG: type II secretion system protein [bacterium]|nr:type II secretion system protein [bacterium]